MHMEIWGDMYKKTINKIIIIIIITIIIIIIIIIKTSFISS